MHNEHEYGIENGIAANCDRCLHYKAYDLDTRNFYYVFGKSRDELHEFLENIPGLYEVVITSNPAQIIANRGQIYVGGIHDPIGQQNLERYESLVGSQR